MAFLGKTIFITGATGIVGSGAVKEFLEQGANVIATSRSKASLDKLTTNLQGISVPTEKLIPIVVDISNDQEFGKIANQIRKKTLPEIDHVISSAGPWWDYGQLHEITFDQWNKVMSANVDPHFITYRNLMPLLLDKPGSSYTLVSGASGVNGLINNKSVSIIGVVQNVLFGIGKVARNETKERAVRFNELMIGYRIEYDATYKKLLSEGKISENSNVTTSWKFGSIFISLAKANNVKSELVSIASQKEKEEFEKKNS